MVIGILIAIVYTLGSIVDLYMATIGGVEDGIDLTSGILGIDLLDWRLFTVGPMWLLVILSSVIAIWIGYSMLTTPAPVPLEELEEELAAEEAAEEAGESA